MNTQVCKMARGGANTIERSSKLTRKPYLGWRCVLNGFTFVALVCASGVTGYQTASAQTLDEAVKRQLELGPNTVVCEELLAGSGLGVLVGPLGESPGDLCGRDAGIAGASPSQSTGGGAATPTTLPSIVQQRLREARGEEEKPATTVSAASADAAVEGPKRRGFFIAAESEALDRDVTTFEDGYDSDIERLVVGVDFQTTARWVAGFAFDASKHDGDFEEGGDFEVKSYGIVGFGSFLPTDKTFMQFYGGYARNSYERNRVATFEEEGLVTTFVRGIPNADYDADQYSAGILGGYNFAIRNVTISPFVGVDWKRIEFDTYSETGGAFGLSGLELTFHDDEDTSLQSSIGVQAFVALRSGSWVVVPQASLIWKHESDQDQRDVEVSFVGDTRAKRFTYQTEKPDDNWGEINVGVIGVSPNGLQVFGNYRTLVEHEFFDSDAVTIGLRLPF